MSSSELPTLAEAWKQSRHELELEAQDQEHEKAESIPQAGKKRGPAAEAAVAEAAVAVAAAAAAARPTKEARPAARQPTAKKGQQQISNLLYAAKELRRKGSSVAAANVGAGHGLNEAEEELLGFHASLAEAGRGVEAVVHPEILASTAASDAEAAAKRYAAGSVANSGTLKRGLALKERARMERIAAMKASLKGSGGNNTAAALHPAANVSIKDTAQRLGELTYNFKFERSVSG